MSNRTEVKKTHKLNFKKSTDEGTSFKHFYHTQPIEAQFQFEAPDPYPLNKRRTELGKLVVLSSVNSVTLVCLSKLMSSPVFTFSSQSDRLVKYCKNLFCLDQGSIL